MNFDDLVNYYLTEASDSLHQWFKRGGTDPKTGKKFSGWINCKTGGPCGRKSKKSGGSYPHALSAWPQARDRSGASNMHDTAADNA